MGSCTCLIVLDPFVLCSTLEDDEALEVEVPNNSTLPNAGIFFSILFALVYAYLKEVGHFSFNIKPKVPSKASM